MTQYAIPSNRSSLVGRELEYIFKATTTSQIAGDHMLSKRCHGLLESISDSSKWLLEKAFLSR